MEIKKKDMIVRAGKLALISGIAVLDMTGARAQTSLTMFGVVDNGIIYQNSQTTLGSNSGGRSNVKLSAGNWLGSRWGFKGSEELGGGTKAIFTLESRFNTNTGGGQFTNAAFGGQGFVGVTNPLYGTLTAGRQYTPYYTLLYAFGPTPWLSGETGAHPGDIDGLDSGYRVNNSLVYTSPVFAGFTVGASYALSGVPGTLTRGSTWSLAAQYVRGPVSLAAGFERFSNSNLGGGAWGADSTATTGGQPGVSALTNGYQTNAAQQRIAVTGAYAISSAFDMSFSYSNVQYVPGINSSFHDLAVFNTVGTVGHWHAGPALDVGGGYSYTWTSKANGIENPAQYHQVSLAESYALSKRTTLYFLQAWQRASGQTLGTAGAGDVINATATIGDGFQSAPASGRTQIAAGMGIAHRF
ncbi:putative porin [Paraburkholderia unamae]|uniref:porin n=1 Tax=Paraburkholderia unamae TaxID=219649 RepID=UPI000DC359E0|nr:putative porin [Paraburkholderia unamae]